MDSGTRLFCTRPSSVSDRGAVRMPRSTGGARGDELKAVGKAVRSFLFRGSSAGTYSRSEENVADRIFIRRRRGLVFFVRAEPSFLLGKSGGTGMRVVCKCAANCRSRDGPHRRHSVPSCRRGSAGWRSPLVHDLSHSLPGKEGEDPYFLWSGRRWTH